MSSGVFNFNKGLNNIILLVSFYKLTLLIHYKNNEL